MNERQQFSKQCYTTTVVTKSAPSTALLLLIYSLTSIDNLDKESLHCHLVGLLSACPVTSVQT